jgi:hypothetical protein
MIYNFQNVMEPDEDLAVDEILVTFRGRLGFKQYIPGKSHKYGVKLFKLCGTNGYTYNVQIYAGCCRDQRLYKINKGAFTTGKKNNNNK